MPSNAEMRKAADEAWAAVANPQRVLIKVGVTTCSRVLGAEETLAALRKEVAERQLEADVMLTGCWGLCYAEPIVEVRRPGRAPVLYQHVTADKVPSLVEQAVAAEGIAREHALAVVAEGAVDGVPALKSLDFFRLQVRRLMAGCGVIDPENIEHYIAQGGYEGLDKALRLAPDRGVQEVKEH